MFIWNESGPVALPTASNVATVKRWVKGMLLSCSTKPAVRQQTVDPRMSGKENKITHWHSN